MGKSVAICLYYVYLKGWMYCYHLASLSADNIAINTFSKCCGSDRGGLYKLEEYDIVCGCFSLIIPIADPNI